MANWGVGGGPEPPLMNPSPYWAFWSGCYGMGVPTLEPVDWLILANVVSESFFSGICIIWHTLIQQDHTICFIWLDWFCNYLSEMLPPQFPKQVHPFPAVIIVCGGLLATATASPLILKLLKTTNTYCTFIYNMIMIYSFRVSTWFRGKDHLTQCSCATFQVRPSGSGLSSQQGEVGVAWSLILQVADVSNIEGPS